MKLNVHFGKKIITQKVVVNLNLQNEHIICLFKHEILCCMLSMLSAALRKSPLCILMFRIDVFLCPFQITRNFKIHKQTTPPLREFGMDERG